MDLSGEVLTKKNIGFAMLAVNVPMVIFFIYDIYADVKEGFADVKEGFAELEEAVVESKNKIKKAHSYDNPMLAPEEQSLGGN